MIRNRMIIEWSLYQSLDDFIKGSFYEHGLTFTPAWIPIRIESVGVIIHPFSNVDGCIIEVV